MQAKPALLNMSHLPPVQKPKVLLYYPDFGMTGGIEHFIIDLAQGLIKRGTFQPVVACSADTPFYHQVQAAGITVRGVRTFQAFIKPGWRWLDLLTLAQLKLILDEEQPDLLHIHIGQLENIWLSLLGYPMLYSFHGYGSLYSTDIAGRLKKLAKKSLRPLFEACAARMQRLIFVSHYEHERMMDEGYLTASTCPVEVIHNAIDVTALFRKVETADVAAFKAQNEIVEGTRCITFINRMDANKNPLGFVAWAEAYASNWPATQPPLMFLLAGDGPLASETVFAISKSPLARQFRFLGFQTDIAPVLAATDVAVFIPQREGFGIGILECLASGTPCVAPRVGGIPEIFTQELAPHCLFTANDWQGLSRLVTQWLNADMFANARLRQTMVQTASRFSLDPFIEAFERVYEDVRTRFYS